MPKVNSPVKKFYVERGSKVQAGQVLADLESQDLAGSLADTQGGLQRPEAGYQESLQKSQQDLKLSKEVLDAAQKLYDGRAALYKQGAVSAKDVDDASVSLTQARNAYESAQKQQDLKVAEGQLASAKGQASSAQAQLSYAKIVRPISGVVTDRPFYPGEMPAGGAPVITVMNLSQVIARAHISQQEAAQLKVGDAATLSVPGQTPDVKGKVTLISPALDPGSTTVEVWVQVPNPAGKLKPGASGRATIIAETVNNTIVAPAAALLTALDAEWHRLSCWTPTTCPQEKSSGRHWPAAPNVQITSGLKNHERVVTVGAFELYNEDDPILAKTKIQIAGPQDARTKTMRTSSERLAAASDKNHQAAGAGVPATGLHPPLQVDYFPDSYLGGGRHLRGVFAAHCRFSGDQLSTHHHRR